MLNRDQIVGFMSPVYMYIISWLGNELRGSGTRFSVTHILKILYTVDEQLSCSNDYVICGIVLMDQCSREVLNIHLLLYHTKITPF